MHTRKNTYLCAKMDRFKWLFFLCDFSQNCNYRLLQTSFNYVITYTRIHMNDTILYIFVDIGNWYKPGEKIVGKPAKTNITKQKKTSHLTLFVIISIAIAKECVNLLLENQTLLKYGLRVVVRRYRRRKKWAIANGPQIKRKKWRHEWAHYVWYAVSLTTNRHIWYTCSPHRFVTHSTAISTSCNINKDIISKSIWFLKMLLL